MGCSHIASRGSQVGVNHSKGAAGRQAGSTGRSLAKEGHSRHTWLSLTWSLVDGRDSGSRRQAQGSQEQQQRHALSSSRCPACLQKEGYPVTLGAAEAPLHLTNPQQERAGLSQPPQTGRRRAFLNPPSKRGLPVTETQRGAAKQTHFPARGTTPWKDGAPLGGRLLGTLTGMLPL